MSESKFYSYIVWEMNSGKEYTVYEETNRDYHLETDDRIMDSPSVIVNVARGRHLPETLQDAKKLEKLKHLKEDAFLSVYNDALSSFQKRDFRGGEYYLSTDKICDYYSFWAFTEKPRQSVNIWFSKLTKESQIGMSLVPTLWMRKGRRANAQAIPEGVFMQVYSLIFEFMHDRTAFTVYHEKLFSQIAALASPPGEGGTVPAVVLNQDYYFTQARERMLGRKNEILSRLVDMDDDPARRKELRAEIKGIEFCISILEGGQTA